MEVNMTEQERARIVSEEYADLIIDYRSNPLILEGIPNSTVQIMNETYAIIYVPVSQLVGESVGLYGYTAAPNLYGLASEVALEASKVPELREIETLNVRGTGVLIGIVDTGINYTLPVFKKTDGTTKVIAIWDQTIQSENFPREANFGTEYQFEQINEAIRAINPRDIVPSMDENGHGTMLAAVAAGTELSENDFYGVAPEAELVVVKLRQAKEYLRNFFVIPEGVVCFQENAIMWGIQYCIQVARQLNRPIAICIGVGSSQDTHDGNSPLSTLVSMRASFPKTGIVICAGNEGNLGRHFHGNIDPSIGNTTVELNVGENDSGFTMELWGDAPGVYSIDILSPSGEYIPRIIASLRVRREIAFIFEETLIYVEYHTVESGSGDQLILIRFRNISSGVWKLTVYGQGDLATGFHIWLPMGNMISRDTYFVQADIYTTLLEPGTATVPLTVTAYNPLNNTLYTNASRGFTRSNVIKPELAAPGVNYLAPDLNGGFINYTGTGVAAAHTTGILALMLEWGVVFGNQPNINTVEMKNYLIRGARRSSNLTYPNRDWGYGILDVYNAYNVFRLSQ
jgi:subtilisin family serine protease